MAAPEADEPEKLNPWEQLLRKMLPEGAPLPDEDQLDYSISVDYVGPSPFFRPPIYSMIPKTRFNTFPKRPSSFAPINPPWLKARCSSESVDSDNKMYSASSIAFDCATDENSDDGRAEADGDHGDCECTPRSDEMKRRVRSPSIWNKRRGCIRCGKGRKRLLRVRVQCIVCGAEYCKRCVLKGMGSMPEGRKCIGCIGRPIDELNRMKLGKGSRLLSRLCSQMEVKQIMQAERESKVNKMRPELVIVNGRQLREEELEELLYCAVPPKDLKPGRYWYDKESGLWGKEGKKPDRIISSKLGVAGKLRTDASSGNTKVFVNGREITKVELRVLKLAKVQCPRGTHFWLYEDGSYEEEGQNNIKGYLWEKASIRFLCSLFSLPVPPENAHCAKGESISTARFLYESLEQHRVQKLLLLGLHGSGTSTIFKQAMFISKNKFTTEELQKIKLIIQSNIGRYISILLEGREQFEDEALLKRASVGLSVPGEPEFDGSRQCIYSLNQRINDLRDRLLDLMATGDVETLFPAAAREYASIIDGIWKDPAIQETYKRREELHLPDVAKYFLDRAIEILGKEHEPSEKDILFAEGITPSNGIACVEFSFDDAISELYNQHLNTEHLSKFQLIQLRSKGLHDGFKWLEMLEGMDAVVFCVSLCDYDKLWTNSTGLQQNKMLANRDTFLNVARNSCFEGTPFLLLLTKYDAFEEKVHQIPLTVCEWFRDFNPYMTHSKDHYLARLAFHYIAVKFKKLYNSINGRKLYVCPVRSHERGSVGGAFRYVKEILLWEELKCGVCAICG